MLKNIKLFSTDSDRTTYESSASYETPYVSKVSADNNVHYNKPIVLITFTVNGDEFQAEQGMTWSEFINSSYNSGDFTIALEDYIRYKGNYLYYMQGQSRNSQYTVDQIRSYIAYLAD